MGLSIRTWNELTNQRRGGRTGNVRIVGCGRWRHSDDQFGLMVARKLANTNIDAEVSTTEAPGFDLVLDLDQVDLLIVIDTATASDEFPVGSLRKFTVDISESDHQQCAILRSSRKNSIHTFSVSEALQLAGALGCVPHNVWVYTVAAERFGPGFDLTPEVETRVDEVVERIEADLELRPCLFDKKDDFVMTSAGGA